MLRRAHFGTPFDAVNRAASHSSVGDRWLHRRTMSHSRTFEISVTTSLVAPGAAPADATHRQTVRTLEIDILLRDGAIDADAARAITPRLSRSLRCCLEPIRPSHQLACATQYPVAGGVSWRYRCYDHSKLFAGPGPAIPENCTCVPNTTNDQEEDVSDNSGLCVSSDPPAPDRPDPPDCEEKGCSGG